MNRSILVFALYMLGLSNNPVNCMVYITMQDIEEQSKSYSQYLNELSEYISTLPPLTSTARARYDSRKTVLSPWPHNETTEELMRERPFSPTDDIKNYMRYLDKVYQERIHCIALGNFLRNVERMNALNRGLDPNVSHRVNNQSWYTLDEEGFARFYPWLEP